MKGQKHNTCFAFALSGRWVCILFTQGNALGYYLVAPLGRFGELRIIILGSSINHIEEVRLLRWVLFFVTFGVILFLVAYGEKLNKLKIKFLNNFEH